MHFPAPFPSPALRCPSADPHLLLEQKQQTRTKRLQPQLAHRFLARPGNAVSGAGRRPGRLGGRRRPRRPGRARAETEARRRRRGARRARPARGHAGRPGGGEVPGAAATPLPATGPRPPPLRTCVGVPRRSPCPHNRVRPTYLTPRAGRRAGGRKEGRAAAGQPGVGGGFGPHLARPPRTTRRELGFRPDALPKSPRRR